MKKVYLTLISAIFLAGMTILPGCKKDAEIPTLSTEAVSMITETTALTGGKVTSGGGSEITARGVCWSTSHNPTVADNKTTDGAGSGTFSSNITGLMPNSQYYVRAYATNSTGTGYGNEISFTSILLAKATLTTAIASFASTYAVAEGSVMDSGGSDITEEGICWSTSHDPTTDDYKKINESDLPAFLVHLTGLTPGTTYYVRAYAVNKKGTSFGNEMTFTTPEQPDAITFNPVFTYGSVSDVDGNVYKTIQIGSQTWMAENLRTTRYNNGESIPLVTDNAIWNGNTGEGYAWYNNTTGPDNIYGALYNWYTARIVELCPAGWHVPNSAEWTTLQAYLGGESVSGGKVKEAGLAHWGYPNTGANNVSGWTALPGGLRVSTGEFSGIGFNGVWWTSDDQNQNYANCVFLGNAASALEFDSMGSTNGASVRCLKDN